MEEKDKPEFEYVSAKEIAKLAGCGLTNARILMKKVNEKAEKDGFYIGNHHVAYKQRVLRELGLQGETK